MTIQECYRQMGANYEDVLKRLYNEGMICRFTLMFLNDDSYPKLEQALKEGNVKEAFRAAHTLKGVCQNLGFTNLYQPTYDLTEVLRTGTLEGTKELFDSVTCQYKITINAIRALLVAGSAKQGKRSVLELIEEVNGPEFEDDTTEREV